MGFAEKHLPESQRIQIARELFKITSEEPQRGELHGLCPIHEEKNPSFSYNYKKDQYNCFSCGATGDLLRLFCEVNHHGQKEGFKAFCETFSIETDKRDKRPGRDKETPELDHALVVEKMHEAWGKFIELPRHMIKDLEIKRGWTRETIKFFGLKLQTHYLDKKGELLPVEHPDRIAIPIYDTEGNLANIRLYKPGAKQYKIISFARSTGASRLFPAKPHSIYPLILCEGESDTICALSHGLNAITQTSKLKTFPKEQKDIFKDLEVIIAYDADEPGQKYTYYAAQELTGTAKSIRTIHWPPFMGIDETGGVPRNHGQDLTDYFIRHNKTADDFKELIDTAEKPQFKTHGHTSAPGGSGGGSGESFPPPSDDSAGVKDFFEHGVNNRFSFKPRLLAEKLLSQFKLLSDPESGLLYLYNGKYWEYFDEDHLKNIAIHLLENEYQKSRVEDALYGAKMLVTLPHGRAVNDQMDWVCLQNGMLNFNTFELAPHDPDFYCTHALPVSFDENSIERCTRWEEYLEQTIQTAGPIAQVQEFAGYCITRHTRYEKCLFLYGPGADGKSTFMKVLKELVGNENCAAVSFAGLENEFHRSSLYNKLLNISTEVGGQAIESPYFKAVTSGDPIDAAFKHQNSFTFSPYCKLIFAGNIMPRVKDNSDGFFRKILPVSFKRQFREDDPDRDPELLDKLKGELSEIFYWALCGLKRLTEQRKFTDCEETRSLIMGYRRTNNPVLCYVEDKCVLGEEKVADKSELYADYRKYCGENGFMPVNVENFYRELYAAISNLRLYRPSYSGRRENKIKGIGIVHKED